MAERMKQFGNLADEDRLSVDLDDIQDDEDSDGAIDLDKMSDGEDKANGSKNKDEEVKREERETTSGGSGSDPGTRSTGGSSGDAD